VGQKREKAGAVLCLQLATISQYSDVETRSVFSLFIRMKAEGSWTGRAVEIFVAVRERERT
jgi:hypothetical protein